MPEFPTDVPLPAVPDMLAPAAIPLAEPAQVPTIPPIDPGQLPAVSAVVPQEGAPENFLGLTPAETYQLAASLMQPLQPNQNPVALGLAALSQGLGQAGQRKEKERKERMQARQQLAQEQLNRDRLELLKQQHAERMAVLRKQLEALKAKTKNENILGKKDKAKLFKEIMDRTVEMLQAADPTGRVNMGAADLLARQQFNSLLVSVGEEPSLVPMPKATINAMAQDMVSPDPQVRKRAMRRLDAAASIYTPESLDEVRDLAVQLAEEAPPPPPPPSGGGLEPEDVTELARRVEKEEKVRAEEKARREEINRLAGAASDLVSRINAGGVPASVKGASKFVERAQKILAAGKGKDFPGKSALIAQVKRVLAKHPELRQKLVSEKQKKATREALEAF